MFWRTAGRILIVIPFAMLIALATVMFIIVTLGLERVTAFLHAAPIQADDPEQLFAIMDQSLMLIASLTLIPALLVVVIGEIARIRSWIYYVASGGLALAAIPLLARYGQSGTITSPEALVWQVFATAGFAGGFVYWLIAGRNA